MSRHDGTTKKAICTIWRFDFGVWGFFSFVYDKA
jgi:hypothetical protein